MKKLNLKKAHYLVMALLICLSACQKGEPGPQGEKGAQGATGQTGAQGPAGQTGAQGPAGSSNVIYSDWITNTWEIQTSGSQRYVVDLINAPQITRDILDKGMILVYMRVASNSTGVNILPLTVYDRNNANPLALLEYNLTVGQIEVYHTLRFYGNVTGTIGMHTEYPNSQIRYVIIPGSVKAASTLKTDQIEKLDYKSVCDYYHIDL